MSSNNKVTLFSPFAIVFVLISCLFRKNIFDHQRSDPNRDLLLICMSPGPVQQKLMDIREQISRGADVESVDLWGSTPLMFAVVWTTDVRILGLLISSIENFLHENRYGNSFLTILIDTMGTGRTQREVLRTMKFVFTSYFDKSNQWRKIKWSVLEATSERLFFDQCKRPNPLRRVTRGETRRRLIFAGRSNTGQLSIHAMRH